MVDIAGLIRALGPEELEEIRRAGRLGPLSPSAVAAIDRAAGGPGEGRGYYVYPESDRTGDTRTFVLRHDVAAEIFGPATQGPNG